ncbi:calcium-binding protein [Antarcticimicrobium luteum]|uniref:Calcium-binding protein n=1 Tax=Antarcticimicrobium luteum TaxID=2547397 RepID=A0A4R5V3A0_9RHOB|nr:calcium-binding protein [Antarcticimicrobium luteum]TDK46224.1 calcium-binding protein [Antarcticimicrobium luteum]
MSTMSGSYSDFLGALRMRESSGDYTAVNTLGYLGAYQFGEAALVDLGFVHLDSNAFDNDFSGGFTGKLDVFSADDFLASPAAQDAAALDWMPLMWRYIGAVGLDGEVGHVVDGILLTASGLLAGAHLLGAGTLRTWVRSEGTLDLRDAYGTPISDYIGLFGGYEIPFVASSTFAGDDTLVGDDAGNRLAGRSGDDTITAAGGRDRLFGGTGRDTLKGNGGADTLKGGAGRDKLLGGRGDDSLDGGGHRDRLKGQGGDDILTGGAGADRFVFARGGGGDTITDFTDDVDAIRFVRLGDAASILDLAVQLGDDVLFDFGGDDRLTVLDTSLGALGDDILA